VNFHKPEQPAPSEKPARPSQSYVDAVGHYRNLAISLGATPEQMLNTFDRDLCRNGLDFERGDYTVDDACGDLAEVWDEVDRLRDALIQMRDWYMLTLNADGTGESLDDARWAREIIADALGESIWVDS
jgi:hypothetical protein